jgi:hypothetical protein
MIVLGLAEPWTSSTTSAGVRTTSGFQTFRAQDGVLAGSAIAAAAALGLARTRSAWQDIALAVSAALGVYVAATVVAIVVAFPGRADDPSQSALADASLSGSGPLIAGLGAVALLCSTVMALGLGRLRRWSRTGRFRAIAAAVILAVAGLVLDVVSDIWVVMPFTAAFAGAALLFSVTALGIEHWIETRERERWERVAQQAWVALRRDLTQTVTELGVSLERPIRETQIGRPSRFELRSASLQERAEAARALLCGERRRVEQLRDMLEQQEERMNRTLSAWAPVVLQYDAVAEPALAYATVVSDVRQLLERLEVPADEDLPVALIAFLERADRLAIQLERAAKDPGGPT